MPQQTTWRYCPQHRRPFRATPEAPYCPFGPPPGCAPEWTRPAREQEVPRQIELLRSGRVIPPEAQAPLGRRAPQETKPAEPISPYVWREPDGSGVRRAPGRAPPLDRNGRQHAADGRYLALRDADTRHPDEGMPEAQVRAGLRKLWFASPRGCRTQLARMLGFSGRHACASLRGLVKRGTPMLPAIRRRASRLLWAIERGDLVIVELPLRHSEGKPVRRWRAVRAVPGIVVPAYRRMGRPRKVQGGGVSA